jgi:rod shape-determining protein MreD
MRTATCVLVIYVVLLLLGALWWRLGWLADFRPEVAGIAASYLGLTARRSLAGAVGASIVTGYLADLLGGVPTGLYALIAGMLCIAAYLLHRRILVRGLGMTLGFSFLVGLISSILVVIIRAITGAPLYGPFTEIWLMLTSGVATAAVGPPIFRLLRRIDAAFARTHREKDQALEGLA